MKHRTKTIHEENPQDPVVEFAKSVFEVMSDTARLGQVHSAGLKFNFNGEPFTALVICKPGHVQLEQQVLVEQIITMYSEPTQPAGDENE